MKDMNINKIGIVVDAIAPRTILNGRDREILLSCPKMFVKHDSYGINEQCLFILIRTQKTLRLLYSLQKILNYFPYK